MAALRTGAAYIRFLRSSARLLLSCKKPEVPKSGKWMRVLYTGIASLSVGAGLCAVPVRQVENLSHDALIRRAATLVTDSSGCFLSQTTLALIETITEYSKAVHTLIAVQRGYLASLGNLSPAEEDSVWQVIIRQRAEVNDRQDECKRFKSAWDSAVNMCQTAAEAAYISGAQHASITITTHIQVAESQVKEAEKLSADADKMLAESKVMEVERMSKHAASTESNSDDQEVPEAYLRED